MNKEHMVELLPRNKSQNYLILDSGNKNNERS
jgi:hypothetical protein